MIVLYALGLFAAFIGGCFLLGCIFGPILDQKSSEWRDNDSHTGR